MRLPRVAILAVLATAGLGIVLAPPSLWLAAAPDNEVRLPAGDEKLVDVRIEGNTTIPTDHIAKYVKTRAGSAVSPKQIQDDVRSLFGTRWFFSVEPRYRRTERGLVLVFRVIERPMVRRVEYRGNKEIKTKYLAEQTGIKPNSPFDIAANRESARRLLKYYHEKGYRFAKVELTKGGKTEDKGEVVFDIDEGPKVRVGGVKFEGNDFFSSALLKTKLRTKIAIAYYFGGLYDPKTIPDDIASLKQYYHSVGFFDVKITHAVGFNDDKSRAYILYTIDEGPRYKVRQLKIVGNKVISTFDLRKDLKLIEGQYFNARFLARDVDGMKDKYDELGRLFAKVDARPTFLEEPGVADLVYRIDEDYVYRIRRINVVFRNEHSHTRRTVVLNRMLIHPGDLANRKLIERSKGRIRGSQVFATGQQNPQNAPDIVLKPAKLGDIQQAGAFRGQNDDFVERLRDDGLAVPRYGPGEPFEPRGNVDAFAKQSAGGSLTQLARATSENPFDVTRLNSDGTRRLRPTNYRKPPEIPLPFTDTPPPSFFFKRPAAPRRAPVFRGQSFDNGIRQPVGPQFGNDPNDPFGRSPAVRDLDLDVLVSDTQTGRLMFGVGVNSDAGVVGSIILNEFDFDITKFPRSTADLSTAFRGNGERFRIEAVPGNVVSRYLVSWTSPYFLDTDYSLSLSGFYYKRFLQDWDEQRAGGRIALGKQLSPTWSVAGNLRLEEVQISNPDVPTPGILARAVGSSLLSSAGLSVTHDTRDSAFLPGEGHLLELGFEQAFGDFLYPRATVSGSQYFTLYERAAGGGRHILTLRGQLGWTDSGTPIFERFYAGGFQTFRGFEFRGVSPRQLGVRTGGRWMAVGSVEYMLPLMANESIQGVAFTDFGTVENDIGFDQFRVTAGFGLRLTIPAMGPVPLAFDFAFPVLKERFDDEQIFSFYVGFNR